MKVLSKPPSVHPAPGFAVEGLRALFFEGLPYRGRPTQVFAWYGVPEKQTGERVPAMILVHGGGGTAFEEWVRVWNEHGYAALALDTNGSVPLEVEDGWSRHAYSGPGEWGGFSQLDEPLHEQWTYHAVADAILANSLLRSFVAVDPERIGVTGISWGAYVACIVAGVDHRYRIAIPVYGCGFLRGSPLWQPVFAGLGPQRAAKWSALWDPSRYLRDAGMPMLWVTGTNDPAYPLDLFRKSCRLPAGQRTLRVRVGMLHNHRQGRKPQEIYAFADWHLKNGRPLARISAQGRAGTRVWATYTPDVPVVEAELNFTKDADQWQTRRWEILPANVEPIPHTVWADLPDGVTVYYLNLIDSRGLMVSTEHVEIDHADAQHR